MTSAEVLANRGRFAVERADVLDYLRALPADSVDLIFTSPPYEMARLYLENGVNLGIARDTEKWVTWLVEVWGECRRVCTGLVAMVVAGQTRKFRWSAGPALLAADLHRAGFSLRNPAIFHRVGIPGSGGPDWLRNDMEWIICTSRPGKLPWSDNTAAGHPPKWAPGGEMSHQTNNGRVNGRDQWGRDGSTGNRNAKGERKEQTNAGVRLRVKGGSPKDSCKGRRHVSNGHDPETGEPITVESYLPPVLANPGNIIKLNVGGGVMGDELCHLNEAPFPEKLAEFFVKSFCPPGGIVCDPYSGSGTTGKVAVSLARRFVGCDLRQSQVDIAQRRIEMVTPDMFEDAEGRR